MRVHIFKAEDGTLAIYVEPSIGARKAPVVLLDITKGNVRGRVAPVLEDLRRPSPATPGEPH